jgi:two-component system NarL family response regulator
MTQISVVVVDGQRTFADALAVRLAAEPGLLLVCAAESAAAARRLLAGRHVDVVLLDSELTEGLDLATDLASTGSATTRAVRVIMLGTMPAAAHIVAALRTGIAGWVPKDESIEQLLGVIRGVMRDETWLPAMAVGPVLRLLLDERDEREASSNHPLGGLTPREREVLSYLADGIGRREVAERMHLSANTVRSHLQNLMAKLDVHTTLEAVALARRAPVRAARPKVTSWS